MELWSEDGLPKKRVVKRAVDVVPVSFEREIDLVIVATVIRLAGVRVREGVG